VVGELYDGVYRSADASRNLDVLNELLEAFTSLPFDDKAAQVFGAIRVQLDALGTPIGPYDLQIASIALASGLTVVTHNVGEFSRVPGLTVEDWQI
jgi:tRNA(fMet)-specific endonuclease VapC